MKLPAPLLRDERLECQGGVTVGLSRGCAVLAVKDVECMCVDLEDVKPCSGRSVCEHMDAQPPSLWSKKRWEPCAPECPTEEFLHQLRRALCISLVSFVLGEHRARRSPWSSFPTPLSFVSLCL